LHSNTGVRTCTCEIDIWLGSSGASNNLGNFFTNWFQSLTHRCIRIGAGFYIRDGVRCGGDGTGRHVMGRDGRAQLVVNMVSVMLCLNAGSSYILVTELQLKLSSELHFLVSFKLKVPCVEHCDVTRISSPECHTHS
jgi:hypothetical protein